MIDYADCDPRLLDDLREIVELLTAEVGLDPDDVLVVGAVSRDIMHSALGHDFRIRGTTDADLGIALNEWSMFESIVERFASIGDTGIRFNIAGIPVDILPFGGIESPDGIARPKRRGQELVVFGFDDVYARADRLQLGSSQAVRIPTPAGYGALKMRAWVDRSPSGQEKDARDLAIAAYWYCESAAISDRLYNTPDGIDALERFELDQDLASVAMLGLDIRATLSQSHFDDLISRWNLSDLELFARYFTLPADAAVHSTLARRAELIRALVQI